MCCGKRVAVIGAASGYGGLQILPGCCRGIPGFEVSFLGGERSSGKRWSAITPFLPLPGDPLVQSPDPEAIAAAADFAVLSLPNALAAQLVPLLERGVRVVDLSADYRYRSLETWQTVSSVEAAAVLPGQDGADLCAEAVYGLPEWEGRRMATARLVAAPGCFPTASLLGLLPLLKQGLIDTLQRRHVIDAMTGTSGKAAAPPRKTCCWRCTPEAIAPYGVVGHRHTSEIEQIAGQVAGQPIQLQFTPHLVPMVRGLLATLYARLRDPGLTAEDCRTVLSSAYPDSPCVQVLPVGTYPSTKWVRQTNRALLSVQADPRNGQLIVDGARSTTW